MVLDLNEPLHVEGETSVRTVSGENWAEPSARNDVPLSDDGSDPCPMGGLNSTSWEGGDRKEDDQNPENLAQSIVDRLAPGHTVESLEQAYILYCEYVWLTGFSIKKGTQGYFRKTADLRMKMFHCSCEGHPDNKADLYGLASYKTQVTKTDCKARLRVTRERDGPWTVSVFYDEHNHELLGEDVAYLLRSARNLSYAKKSIVESLSAAGIGVSKSCRWIEKESGGQSNLGFTRKDAYDHMSAVRKVTRVGNADAEEILKYFKAKANAEPYFFWNHQPNDEGRLMNFFFRDCRCADDYDCFGDVLSIDTTFRTNKYNLICTPFVGINHHRQNVMFGVGFLSDETAKSFEWLFKVFLQSMNGKEPKVIFSDQDQELMNGIERTFSTSSHRLCQWQINRNAPGHFGHLNGNWAFKKMWHHCINGCESEEEFNETWQIMLDNFDLEGNNWFETMFNLRRRWASVFIDGRFSAGLRATSRSEATNKVIKDLCSASTSLFDFVTQYDRLITDWRIRERAEDAMCRGMPGQLVKDNRLMRHAARVYTRSVYKIIESEAAHCLNIDVIHSPPNLLADNLEFGISSNCTSTKVRKVHYNRITSEFSCSCKMWESEGLFCRHVLKVFYTIRLTQLPEIYILRRWTREAKNHGPGTWTAVALERDAMPDMMFVRLIMKRAYNMAMECKELPDCRQLMMEQMDHLGGELARKMKTAPAKKKVDNGNTSPVKEPLFKNPPDPESRCYPMKRNQCNANSGVAKKKRKRASPRKKKRADTKNPDENGRAGQKRRNGEVKASADKTSRASNVNPTGSDNKGGASLPREDCQNQNGDHNFI